MAQKPLVVDHSNTVEQTSVIVGFNFVDDEIALMEHWAGGLFGQFDFFSKVVVDNDFLTKLFLDGQQDHGVGVGDVLAFIQSFGRKFETESELSDIKVKDPFGHWLFAWHLKQHVGKPVHCQQKECLFDT